jgi:probable rRNA maturation factor
MAISVSIDRRSWKAARHLHRLATSAAVAAIKTAGADPAQLDLAIRFAGDRAVARLNEKWRGKNGSTNVLSFPAAQAGHGDFLGDVILSAGVIRREAREQGKTIDDHTAHLVVHGVLHLLGHDHQDARAARRMERIEISALDRIGIADPYRNDEVIS